MEQHPIPRQITTFEFKLIGFLTLRQFIFLAIFSGAGVLFFYAVPLPIVNLVVATIIILIGLAFAFIPVNERPLDVFLRNFLKKLFSASQYVYLKKNAGPAIYFNNSKPQDTTLPDNQKKQQVAHLLSLAMKPGQKNQPVPSQHPPELTSPENPAGHVFLAGIITNSKNIHLPGMLVYIKNQQNQLVRILKSNPQGHFATFHPLPDGQYQLEVKDPAGIYFFDKLSITIPLPQSKTILIISKELL